MGEAKKKSGRRGLHCEAEVKPRWWALLPENIPLWVATIKVGTELTPAFPPLKDAMKVYK